MPKVRSFSTPAAREGEARLGAARPARGLRKGCQRNPVQTKAVDRPGRQAKAYQKGRSPTVQNCTSQAKVRDETCPLISGQTDDNDIPPFLDRTAADQEDDDDEDAEPPGAFPPGQGRAGLQEPSL